MVFKSKGRGDGGRRKFHFNGRIQKSATRRRQSSECRTRHSERCPLQLVPCTSEALVALGTLKVPQLILGVVSWSPLPLPSKEPPRHPPFCQDLLSFVKAFQPLGGETPPLFPSRWANPEAQSFPQGLSFSCSICWLRDAPLRGFPFLCCSYFIHSPDKLLTLKFLSQVCLLGYPKGQSPA